MTQDSTLLRGSLATLPRVNLLPPEIEEGRKFRQIQMVLGLSVVAAVGVVGLVYVSAAHSVSRAQENLASSVATGNDLRSETAKYNDVTAIYSRAAASQAMLVTAMGDEVRFSQLLNDMSLSIPDNVWLTNMQYTSTSAVAGSAPTATQVGSTATLIGNLTVSGTAFSHDDVAVWLESLAKQKSYANPYFSNSSEQEIGERHGIVFTSTAGVTDKALSHRYDKAGS